MAAVAILHIISFLLLFSVVLLLGPVYSLCGSAALRSILMLSVLMLAPPVRSGQTLCVINKTKSGL